MDEEDIPGLGDLLAQGFKIPGMTEGPMPLSLGGMPQTPPGVFNVGIGGGAPTLSETMAKATRPKPVDPELEMAVRAETHQRMQPLLRDVQNESHDAITLLDQNLPSPLRARFQSTLAGEHDWGDFVDAVDFWTKNARINSPDILNAAEQLETNFGSPALTSHRQYHEDDIRKNFELATEKKAYGHVNEYTLQDWIQAAQEPNVDEFWKRTPTDLLLLKRELAQRRRMTPANQNRGEL